MVTALLTFGLILQQAAFPTLSRLWRQKAGAGREALDSLVEVLMTGLVPVAVGCTVLADPLVHLFLPQRLRGGRLPAGSRHLASPTIDPGVPLPDHADRPQSRNGGRANAGGGGAW